MSFNLAKLFQIFSIVIICLWFVFSVSILTIVPAIYILSFLGSMTKKTALRGMFVGLLTSVGMLILYWVQAMFELATAPVGVRMPESVLLEIFIVPAIFCLFILAPIAAAIGGAAGSTNKIVSDILDRRKSYKQNVADDGAEYVD